MEEFYHGSVIHVTLRTCKNLTLFLLTGNKLAVYLDFQFYLTFIKNKQDRSGKK